MERCVRLQFNDGKTIKSVIIMKEGRRERKKREEEMWKERKEKEDNLDGEVVFSKCHLPR